MAADNTETLQRLRRVETRVTEIAIVLGVGKGAQQPEFSAGRVQLPSPHASLTAIHEAIPAGWTGPVEIYIGDAHLATITYKD